MTLRWEWPPGHSCLRCGGLPQEWMTPYAHACLFRPMWPVSIYFSSSVCLYTRLCVDLHVRNEPRKCHYDAWWLYNYDHEVGPPYTRHISRANYDRYEYHYRVIHHFCSALCTAMNGNVHVAFWGVDSISVCALVLCHYLDNIYKVDKNWTMETSSTRSRSY